MLRLDPPKNNHALGNVTGLITAGQAPRVLASDDLPRRESTTETALTGHTPAAPCAARSGRNASENRVSRETGTNRQIKPRKGVREVGPDTRPYAHVTARASYTRASAPAPAAP